MPSRGSYEAPDVSERPGPFSFGGYVPRTMCCAMGIDDASNPTLASLFCNGPTTSGSVNSVAGLPGLGRLQLTGHSVDNGTP